MQIAADSRPTLLSSFWTAHQETCPSKSHSKSPSSEKSTCVYQCMLPDLLTYVWLLSKLPEGQMPTATHFPLASNRLASISFWTKLEPLHTPITYIWFWWKKSMDVWFIIAASCGSASIGAFGWFFQLCGHGIGHLCLLYCFCVLLLSFILNSSGNLNLEDEYFWSSQSTA